MNINFSDGTWRQIETWAESRLKSEREKNDAPDLTTEETAVLRGRIAMLKELLALPRRAEAQARMSDPSQ
jgi:hypothetical protein